MCRRVMIGMLAMLAWLVTMQASGQCIAVVDVGADLPHDVTTSRGVSFSYFYNLAQENYIVQVKSAGGEEKLFGPFGLTRGCAPAKLRWESDEFILLESGCGTFCWSVLALPLAPGDQSYRMISRPLEFDRQRNLIVSYAGQDWVSVTALTSGKQQAFSTVRQCQSASEVCFEVEFTDEALRYTWRYEPTDTYSVRLDESLFEVD